MDIETPLESNELNQQSSSKQGGLKTMPFIIANEAFEKVASFGLTPNMTRYLMGGYHMDVTNVTTILALYGAATNFLPVAGAFISDSFLGRFTTILLGCIASLLGMTLMWLTAMIPQAKPPACDPLSKSCKSSSSSSAQLFLLYGSFVLMAIGAGGIRPCSLAFGADQFDKKGDPNSKNVVQSFFNWYYASSSLAVLFSFTAIVYIQDHLGWKVGFGIPAMFMFLSTLLFVLASSYYVKAKPNKSLFRGFAQVTVATFKNRHIDLPPKLHEGVYHHLAGSNKAAPTELLRFLNKACIIQNKEKDLNADGTATNPWSLCTVEQVEELKALLKIIPLWSANIIIGINLNQPTFPYLQVSSMDRHLILGFKIPAGSFAMFVIISLTIWIIIYDRLILPQLVKLTGKPYGIGLKQRMGIGLVLSCTSMAVAAIVESVRRRNAIKQGFADNPSGVLDMSAMWLVPQLCISGVAEAFNAIGQTEFYYSQFPKSMSSIAACFFGLGMAVGSLLVGVIVNVVDDVTKRGGKESWVSSNLNKGHYDYYYWFLVVLNVINFFYYLVCCWVYGPLEGERTRIQNDREDSDEARELGVDGEKPSLGVRTVKGE